MGNIFMYRKRNWSIFDSYAIAALKFLITLTSYNTTQLLVKHNPHEPKKGGGNSLKASDFFNISAKFGVHNIVLFQLPLKY